MSDTPKTDAVVNKSVEQDDGEYMAEYLLVHARQLERENAELREYLEMALHWMRKVDDYSSPRIQDLNRMARAWAHITKAMEGES